MGDVWYAWVPYNDRAAAGKGRPVVVLGWSPNSLVDDSVVLLVPVSSYGGQPKPRNGDIQIADPNLAGLLKPSWIRARRVFNVHPSALDARRGKLGQISQGELNATYTEIAKLFRPGP